jgi:hypothetical protein
VAARQNLKAKLLAYTLQILTFPIELLFETQSLVMIAYYARANLRRVVAYL